MCRRSIDSMTAMRSSARASASTSATMRRAGLVEQPAQVVADVPDALHRDRAACERGGAEDLLCTGPHPLQHAEGGEGGGVARAAAGYVDADHVRGLDPDKVRVLRRGTDVLGHDVASAQGFDVASERAE